MKNILITGCNGQLGNEMQLLAAAHPELTYFFTDVKELDITDETAVKTYIKKHEIDCVINLPSNTLCTCWTRALGYAFWLLP